MRIALALFLACISASFAQSVQYLDQGWKESDRSWFYRIDQGSEFMRYDFFSRVERADSDALFSNPESLRTYGFVYDEPVKPGDYPIGFVKRGNSIGFTCAACHTLEITHAEKRIRIDGGSSLANMEGFLNDLSSALDATLASPEKFSRLAERTLGRENTKPDAMAVLKKFLAQAADERREYNRTNHPDSPYGPARLDAFGRIYNRVLWMAHSKDRVRANAPVSFPYLWDAPRHDYVQWIGSASNQGAGGLARNVGQVVGVFGTVDLTSLRPGYTSSIQMTNLMQIESRLAQLQSPQWPASFPSLDKAKIARGREIFTGACVSCHADIRRDDPKRKITAEMTSIDLLGTDPLTAQNAVNAEADTGILKGRFVHVVGGVTRFGERSSVLDMLRHVVEGLLAQQPDKIVKSSITNVGWFTTERHGQYERDAKNPVRSLLTYKARPLNGVWATAPFLHNGSVPTLYDLLLPADKRPAKFKVGSNQYDPEKAGFVSDQGSFLFDTSLRGNSNKGHEYGTSISEADRLALLEYLKSL